MLEPAAVALHALRTAGSCLGKTVAITGTGMIASVLIQLADIAGAARIIVFGRDQRKMNFLRRIVPRIEFINVVSGDMAVPDSLADIVVEGTGNGRMLSLSLRVCNRQGTVVAMGNPSGDICLEKKDYWKILRKELSLRGTWNSSFGIADRNDWNDVLCLVTIRRLKLSDLVTHHIPLEDLMYGIQLMEERSELSNKVMVVYEHG